MILKLIILVVLILIVILGIRKYKKRWIGDMKILYQFASDAFVVQSKAKKIGIYRKGELIFDTIYDRYKICSTSVELFLNEKPNEETKAYSHVIYYWSVDCFFGRYFDNQWRVYNIEQDMLYVSSCDEVVGILNKDMSILYYAYKKKGKWNVGELGDPFMLSKHDNCVPVQDKYFVLRKDNIYYLFSSWDERIIAKCNKKIYYSCGFFFDIDDNIVHVDDGGLREAWDNNINTSFN